MAKKDSLVKGTLILALAAFVARALGVLQRIPLVYLIKDAGMATYGIAFNIYTPLLTIATAGIPSALSKMVSEKMELGQVAEAERIYKAAVRFALATGLIMTVFLYAFAPYYATRVAGDPDAVWSIRALAPALLLFPLIAMIRGYFQGRQMMMPNGMSQIVEQILRLITSVGLAWLFLALGMGQVWAISGASFGGVMGSVGAMAVLIWYMLRLRRSDRMEGIAAKAEAGRAAAERIPFRTIYGRIFRTSLPIVLFSMTVPMIYLIDSSTVIRLLEPDIGYPAAKDMLGVVVGRAQSLAGIPIILAIALSQSIVPIVSAAYARGDKLQVQQQASKALRLAMITGLPAVLAISIGARPINQLLFPAQSDYISQAQTVGIIAFLTVTAIFQIIMQTTGSILMGLGVMKPLMLQVFVGLSIKLVGSHALAPIWGIYGIMASTALCFIVMMGLGLWSLNRRIRVPIMPPRRWIGLACSVAGVCLAGIPLERLMWAHNQGTAPVIVTLLDTVVVCGLVVLAYVLLLGITRVYTREDLKELPGPFRKWAAKSKAAKGG